MLFNSLQFLIFFPIVTIFYYLLPHKFRWFHLLIASCVFYAAFIPIYILILFATIIIDYIAGLIIESAAGKKRKLFLIFSIIANVGVLAIFKYFNFFIDNCNELLHSLNITSYNFPLLNIILPIGLSFHTFQAMSYTIEVYRRNQKAERHFGIYALYVMFYPQLVAGPIERPQNLLQQFKEEHKFNSQQFYEGLRLMMWGFFKKLVIADRVAQYVNAVFNYPGEYHYLNLIIAVLFFTIQIYCDFSGYSDIAIGAAKAMGFKLMVNFNRPYFAKNIQEFWKKWHISLSTWFRDYLYFSLGGNRVSKVKVYRNVAIVFLLSGLWHGANWTFVIWGALHTLFILGYMFYQSKIKSTSTNMSILSKSMGWLLTFSIVSFAWIFFRANNFSEAIIIVKNIFTVNTIHPFQLIVTDASTGALFSAFNIALSVVMIGLLFSIEYFADVALLKLNKNNFIDIAFCSMIMIIIILTGVFQNSNFIYFQF